MTFGINFPLDRLPSSNPLLDQLVQFLADRVQPPASINSRSPCLAEDWWVEDRAEQGFRFPRTGRSQEDGLRFIWRVAREGRIGLRTCSADPDLLLHQLTLVPWALFHKAQEIAASQSCGKAGAE